jgi:hypothetical protein
VDFVFCSRQGVFMPDDPKKLDDEDEEQTSIKLDLTPPPPKGLDDEEEEESTKVLDWDRAMKKSIEEKPPPKK